MHLLAAGEHLTLVLTTAGLVLAWGLLPDADGATSTVADPQSLEPPLRENERVKELCATWASGSLGLVTDGGRLLTLSRGVGWTQSDLLQ